MKAITRKQTRVSGSKGLGVFVSYSHEDRKFLNRLLIHLNPLQREGLIDLWVDRQLEAGDKWKDKIERAVEHSQIAILLVSADFLASDFIRENEIPLLLQAEKKGLVIWPVILKPCRFARDNNLARFQTFNDPRWPLARMSDSKQEGVYDEIASSLECRTQMLTHLQCTNPRFNGQTIEPSCVQYSLDLVNEKVPITAGVSRRAKAAVPESSNSRQAQ